MKKKLNFTSMALAMSMSCGMFAATGTPLFAATSAVPSDAKTTAVQVLNVEKAANVTAYRIVEPVYNTDGFVKFQNIAGVSLANPQEPSAAEITKITQDIMKNTITPSKVIPMTGSGSTYTANLPAGEYIVLVTDADSADTIYNPMVVSAYYTDANTADSLTASAPLDSSGTFGTVYAKKTSITLDKTILNADDQFGNDDDGTVNGAQGDDLGIGDTGSFQIKTRIPAYSDAYKAKGVTYQIVDEQDDGFDAPKNLKVSVGGTEITAGETTYTSTVNGNDFTLDFNSDFTLSHAGQEVIVTYQAVLNEKAKQKLDKNNDTVTLTYTNDVYDKSHVDTLTDDVSEYTFPIQIKKISAVDGQSTNGGQPIAGAEFTLKRLDAEGKSGKKSFTITTDEDGIAQFDRLDEGTYEVQETKAPAGYALNPDTFVITISPTYGTDGLLSDYKVKMVNTRDNSEIGNITVDAADDDILAGNITDSKLQTLPSTGGQGTRMAIILSSAMAGITICLFLYGKKKEHDLEK